jgi:uncharacterized membrane protein YeaQ/YmgE (transglycosylase-associated protein family)
MKLNLTTIAIGLVVGVIAYKVVTKNKDEKSSFSAACGCGS